MSTVYIFGPGASRHVGYPLASTMGRELLQWMLNHSSGDYRSSTEMLIEKFGESPNIEDVITQLGTAIVSLDTHVEEDRIQRVLLANARAQVGEAVREWFREIHLNPAPVYADFANRVVRPRDVIMTFNYDDSLERELKRIGKWDLSGGYGFQLAAAVQPSPVLVLKLHGSINWLTSIFNGLRGGQFAVGSGNSLGEHPVIHKADVEYLGYSNFSGNVYTGGGALPSLILPGRKKEFFFDTSFGREWQDFWNSLWSQAADSLSRASKVVLVGYNLLPVDERACDLILNTPFKTAEVVIVSGDQGERIAGDLRRAGFGHVSFKANAYFEPGILSAQGPGGSLRFEYRHRSGLRRFTQINDTGKLESEDFSHGYEQPCIRDHLNPYFF